MYHNKERLQYRSRGKPIEVWRNIYNTVYVLRKNVFK